MRFITWAQLKADKERRDELWRRIEAAITAYPQSWRRSE